jgi:aminotransferase in exopolysaccharide biosynthesis
MRQAPFDEILRFIRGLYPGETPVPLHAPRFLGNEKKYLSECIDSTFVSYVGPFVERFEESLKAATRARYAVAMVNGTAALQMALICCGVRPGDEVITQALTFAATPAAITHAGATPSFIDVDRDTLGMSPSALSATLERGVSRRDGGLYRDDTGRRIAAVVPMHTFGHPARIEEIAAICREHGLDLIEDAAESIGSSYRGKSTGRFGRASILSFNGNKPVTTGGGGMILTDDSGVAESARHLSTTAKQKHPWEFVHDAVGYNLRLTNLNAAVGCAQMERFAEMLANKRETAARYRAFLEPLGVTFISEPPEARSNYWLNAILLADRGERDAFLERSNGQGVQTRPVWALMHRLPPYAACLRGELPNAEWLEDRLVNLPSSVRL